MRERLTVPPEVKDKCFKQGVVVFIFNSQQEILVVKENSSKPETKKNLGEFGVICETSLKGEDWVETTLRALKEELGIDPQGRRGLFMVNPLKVYLGESLFVDGVLAQVVVLYWRGTNEEIFQQQGGGEVCVVGWKRTDELLLLPLREGVRRVLINCLEQRVFNENQPVSFVEFLSENLK